MTVGQFNIVGLTRKVKLWRGRSHTVTLRWNDLEQVQNDVGLTEGSVCHGVKISASLGQFPEIKWNEW